MTSGYSLRRNNTCHAGASELNCGKTWGTMHRCCPFGTNCGKNDCRTTNRAPEEKQCANSTWSLYYAEDFFCCDVDQIAFMWDEGGRNGWVGCANKGFVLEEKQTSLKAIVEGSGVLFLFYSLVLDCVGGREGGSVGWCVTCWSDLMDIFP